MMHKTAMENINQCIGNNRAAILVNEPRHILVRAIIVPITDDGFRAL